MYKEQNAIEPTRDTPAKVHNNPIFSTPTLTNDPNSSNSDTHILLLSS